MAAQIINYDITKIFNIVIGYSVASIEKVLIRRISFPTKIVYFAFSFFFLILLGVISKVFFVLVVH